MKEPRALIILVDALPYSVGQSLSTFQTWNCFIPLRPGFGYSINLDAELFAGLTPDEVGYFNEWSYNPSASPFPRLGWIGSAMDALGAIYPFDRILHRVVAKLWRKPVGNIPFSQLHLFQPFLLPVWDPGFPADSLFTDFPGFQIVAAHLVPDPKQGIAGRDEAAVSLALKHLRNRQNVFLYLVDLDKVSHIYGTSSPQYRLLLQKMDQWIGELTQIFTSLHPDGDVFLVSDHGMANVHRSVSLGLEEAFGPSDVDTFVYFLDSVMLRVWSKKQEMLNNIQAYLLSLGCGDVLTEEERLSGGLSNRRWGDLIYILHEGVVFSPTTYGRGVPKGMHGYHPRNDSQLAVLAYKGNRLIESPLLIPDKDVRTRDVYAIIRQALLGQNRMDKIS